MNDDEYYSLMNRPSSWQLQQKFKKKQTSKKNYEIKNSVQNSYNNLELRQGSADAQMLLEKKILMISEMLKNV